MTLLLAAWVAASAVWVTDAAGQRIDKSASQYGPDDWVTAPDVLPSDVGWTRIDNPQPVIGTQGVVYKATCSGFPGTDARYSFWVRPGTSPNKLAVYFEGGGMCWDSATCTYPFASGMPATVPQLYQPVATTSDPRLLDGLLKLDNPANPVKDWNVVYIPYCTGDLHAGSVTRIYSNAGHPVLALPSTFPIHHRGFDNFMVVLDWIKRNWSTPTSLLVAGSSAGGYGATFNFPWLAAAYPKARLYVIADASQGVSPAAFDAGTPGRGSWNLQLAPWVFGSDPLQFALSEALSVAANAYPSARLAQYTNVLDATQIRYYGLMTAAFGNGACPNTTVDWYQQMTATLQSYSSPPETHENFRFYLAGGSSHAILRYPTFYTEASGGRVFSSWVAGMLDLEVTKLGWTNAVCPNCIMNMPCP